MTPSERKPERKLKTMRCPICGKTVTAQDPEFPFCTERCRTIDLGKWASGAYRISSPVDDPSVLEDLEEIRKRTPQEDE